MNSLQITRGKDYINWTVDELLEQIRNELELREEYGRIEKKNVRLDHGKRDGVDAARPTTASTLVAHFVKGITNITIVKKLHQ